MQGTVINMQEKAITGLQSNPTIWISTGTSKNSTNWKGEKLLWSTLLGRLQNPKRTPEALAEFMAMTKEQQTAIKDVGGFVGGLLNGPRRIRVNAGDRYLLTFDMDNMVDAPADIIEQLRDRLPYAWAIYSTHKHRPEAPRLRLILPTTRPMTSGEYEPVMRMLAQDADIMPYLDKTTFEVHRLMFWPSASNDAEYVFRYNDAPSINPDHILEQYPGNRWADESLWPLHPDEDRVNKVRNKKVEDPTSKKGIVGIFCRTYTVPDAIDKYLPDVYTATSDDNRYTYAKGSTGGGMVIYDDGRLCYSHHATDPAGSRDLNAFDLVRIHLFGDRDRDGDADKAPTKLPSYRAMQDLIREDENCIETADRECHESAARDFADETEADSWPKRLERRKDLSIMPTLPNAQLILERDPNIQGIRLNELRGTIECHTLLPWRDPRPDPQWKNTDDAQLRGYLAKNYGVRFPKDVYQDAIVIVSSNRGYNPLQDFINGLPEWDKVPRVDTLLIDYLGAADEPYTRAVTRKTLCGAIARALKPGCKYDYMLVLDGPQGIGKSSFFDILGGEFFTDSLRLTDIRTKAADELLQGCWIVEVSEMTGRSRVDMDAIKAFITRRSDNYRAPYKPTPESHPRTVIIVGTTNDTQGFLNDITGNRRFLPVEVKGSTTMNVRDIDEQTRRQIWAEAKHYYDQHEQLYLDPDMEAVARVKQREQLEVTEHADEIAAFLDADLPANWYELDTDRRQSFFRYHEAIPEGTKTIKRMKVSTKEICLECLGRDWSRWEKRDSREITQIMQHIGWNKADKKLTIPKYYDKPARVFVRPGADT